MNSEIRSGARTKVHVLLQHVPATERETLHFPDTKRQSITSEFLVSYIKLGESSLSHAQLSIAFFESVAFLKELSAQKEFAACVMTVTWPNMS
jgi:hypothetical protein